MEKKDEYKIDAFFSNRIYFNQYSEMILIVIKDHQHYIFGAENDDSR